MHCKHSLYQRWQLHISRLKSIKRCPQHLSDVSGPSIVAIDGSRARSRPRRTNLLLSSLRVAGLEFRGKGRRNDANVGVPVGHFRQLVGRREAAGGPAGPAEEDVAVFVEHVESGSDERDAILSVATANLGQHGLTTNATEVGGQTVEGSGDVVCAGGMGTRVVFIQVLVHFEDQVGGGAIGILDALKGGSRCRRKGSSVVKVGAREEDQGTGRASSIANGRDAVLNRRCPGIHVEIMRLVHDSIDDAVVSFVAVGELFPSGGERAARWAALTDNLTPPASIVVDVDDAVSTSGQTRLDNRVVFVSHEGLVELVGGQVVVDERLPRHRQAKDIEAILLAEVGHLLSCHVLAGA